MNKGKLFCLIGTSGSGKTTLGINVFGKTNELVSTTTRDKRTHEKDGVDYHFVSKLVFLNMARAEKFAEEDRYGDHYYGLELREIEEKTKNNNAYAVVTYHGYEQIKELYPDTVSVFIYSPYNDNKDMLINRGDSSWNINKRLGLYYSDMKNKDKCDYVIENIKGFLNESIEMLNQIVEKEEK
ncbi:MAG: hypothetical protein ABF991_00580 [Liquorilactobacillus hordei]|uniref:guanylate kinase n=1 Tax=Liquorilactobacillus hordei TaxID=468911 RepID=UPI0039E8BD79